MEQHAMRPATAARYRACLEEFLAWARRAGVSMSMARLLDGCVVESLEAKYFASCMAQRGNLLLAALPVPGRFVDG